MLRNRTVFFIPRQRGPQTIMTCATGGDFSTRARYHITPSCAGQCSVTGTTTNHCIIGTSAFVKGVTEKPGRCAAGMPTPRSD